ncbi:MAG TPA: MFS transporter, partial [Steroidobacteraceae bacterium]|nr:MFS transporter [Steroidobacteraceae bacterium]
AAAVMYFILPESPRFLATRPQARESLARLLARIDPGGRYSASDEFVLGEELRPTGSGIRALFSPQLRWDTAVMSLAFLMNMYAVYAFFSWAPLVLTSLGFEVVTAVRGALVFNLAGIAGVIAISWLLARVGSRRPLAVAAFAGAVTLAGLAWFAATSLSGGNVADGLPTLMSGIAIAGIAINAVQVGLYALAAHVFPTECRTSGVGFSLGAGRTGGIVAALGGGVLLTLSGAAGFFVWIATALLIACVAVLLVRRQIAPRERYFAVGASTSGA